MTLHTDVPTRSEIESLLAVNEPWCLSIYLPTSPVTQDAQADRIAFKNLVSAGIEDLRSSDPARGEVDAVEEALNDLLDDDEFWAFQANSLAVFATPEAVRTFRLPNELVSFVGVSDRFHVKPMLRSVTFPQAAFVLALAQGAVRLLEISADAPPYEVSVPDLPTDAASAAGKASITDRSASGRLQGSEGQKVLMRQYARHVDQALRGVLAGLELPLILAATQPLEAIFRSVNSYPHLAEEGLRGNPETTSDVELAADARAVLDRIYAAELSELRELFEQRATKARGVTDLGDVARAATFGAADTLFVDIDQSLPGTIDDESGAVTEGDGDAGDYGLTDEIARRVLLSSGRVMAVRSGDVPGGGPLAAILRYPI